MSEKVIGVIGGSGLYALEELEQKEHKEIDTPFGRPSGPYMCGIYQGTQLIFLPRHGLDHSVMPSEINYRANIYGFRQLGVRHVLSVSAVGSLKEAIRPGDVVLPDQFIDRTRGRLSTFFGDGLVAHVQFGDPICKNLQGMVASVLDELKARYQKDGTYVVMDGPAFSTRAESELYRSWDADVIGMTNIPEAKLAREAEICYTTLALSTDYDCWHHSEEEVSVEGVLEVLKKNSVLAAQVILGLAKIFVPNDDCKCQQALNGAIITPADKIPPATKKRMDLLVGKYL
jgi:5'-methylthioadenosine phosphorylase